MSSLQPRYFLKAFKPLLIQTRRQNKLLHPLDLLTGVAKKELLAHMAGDCDPWKMMPIKGGSFKKNKFICNSVCFNS